MAQTKYLKFRGKHPELVDGKFYTYHQLREVIGASYYCIKGRLSGKKECTIDDLYEPYSKSGNKKQEERITSNLETESMLLSQKWLKRRL